MDFYCQVYVFLLLCAFSSVYSVSLCCCVFFACKYVLCYCQPVSTQLQLTNMPYHVTSYHIILLSTVVWKKVTLSYITIRVYESCENKIPAISFFFFSRRCASNFCNEPHLGVAAIFTLKYGVGLLLLRFKHGHMCSKTK